MSHFKEREQKSCLNCNAVVHGRYCHICGQENIEPRETVWHLVSHFFQDITHFDGKFFSTLKYLLFKPGHLSREYLLGRRMSYLNPIRMYVFTSAFFFLFFFSTVNVGGLNTHGPKLYQKGQELTQAKAVVADLQENLTTLQQDSVQQQAVKRALASYEPRIVLLENELADLKLKDSLKTAKRTFKEDSMMRVLQAAGITPKRKVDEMKGLAFSVDELTGFSTVEAYDLVQAELPATARDGWWHRLWLRKGLDINEKANDKSGSFGKTIISKFLHTLPQMFFLSLPLYAFFLLVLYSRERKYYYVNHAIFSIHVFCATFIISFFCILLAKYVTFGSRTLELIYNWIFLFGTLFYQYKAMRNFYQQRRAKTITKFIILSFVSFLSVMLLATIFFVISIWNV